MKYSNRQLAEIGGIDLNNKEKLLIKGGEELQIMCFCDVIGGDWFQGLCGLTSVELCRIQIRAMYPPPDYDCDCEYWFTEQ